MYNTVQHYIYNLLTDINECRVRNGGCQYYCQNTIGSYYCYCKTGYRLYSDKHRCIGTCVVHSQRHIINVACLIDFCSC